MQLPSPVSKGNCLASPSSAPLANSQQYLEQPCRTKKQQWPGEDGEQTEGAGSPHHHTATPVFSLRRNRVSSCFSHCIFRSFGSEGSMEVKEEGD